MPLYVIDNPRIIEVLKQNGYGVENTPADFPRGPSPWYSVDLEIQHTEVVELLSGHVITLAGTQLFLKEKGENDGK